MTSTWNNVKKMLGVGIPASLALLAMGGTALAQVETCPDATLPWYDLPIPDPNFYPGYMPHSQAVACTSKYGGCFQMAGSDTLTDVVEQAISASGACISYHNVGSSQGETNLEYTAGLVTSGQTTSQCMAPMSRNFNSTIIGSGGLATSWAPAPPDNVKALDAAVWSFQHKTGQAVDMEDVPANVCANECPLMGQNESGSYGAIPLSAAAIIMGGYPGNPNLVPEGETGECSSPCRLCLLEWLGSSAMEGSGIMQHLYRRDDKSGTQDTIREIYGFDRWCNGKSEGNTDKVGSNLLNEDLDPVRRSCVGADANHARSQCTYYPTSQPCVFTDPTIAANGTATATSDTINSALDATPITYSTYTATNPYSTPLQCSQGFVVALSEVDPGTTGADTTKDITQSIGMRVALDPQGQSIGIAGLSSAEAPSPPNASLNVDTITTSFVNNIYDGAYKLSRRLFFMTPFGESFASTCAAQAKPPLAGAITEEQHLYDYSMGHYTATGGEVASSSGWGDCAAPDGTAGMQAIAVAAGFLPKWPAVAGCSNTSCLPSSVSSTLACLTPATGVKTPKQNIGGELGGLADNACNASYPCIENGTLGTGSPLTCGGTGSLANDCPLMPAQASGYACPDLSAKCSSGVCTDDGSGKGGVCN